MTEFFCKMLLKLKPALGYLYVLVFTGTTSLQFMYKLLYHILQQNQQLSLWPAQKNL